MSTPEEQAAAAAALAKEREEKKQVVIDAIIAKCKEPSEFEDIQEFGKALEGGDSLKLKILSGGETNFAYKVMLRSDPSKALFAKISLSYALWNPDKSVEYDLRRVDSEFAAMQKFANIMEKTRDGVDATSQQQQPPPVATTYFVVDLLDGDAKLMVTEWSKADVQFSNQFMNGNVDLRVIDNVAKALAELNLTPIEDDWNESCRSCFQSLHPVFKVILGQFTELPLDQMDACAERCKQLGLPDLEEMIDNMDTEYMETRQVFNHNDTKLFNILVEEQPTVDEFGQYGSFALCDWEMSIKGRNGKDVGVFWSWPMACVMCHAVQGRKTEAYHMLDACMKFWDEYAKVLTEKGGKDKAYLVDAFKGALGGHFLYLAMGFYAFGINKEDLPLEGVPDDLAAKAKGAMGLAGLKTGEVAYLGRHSDYNLEQLKSFFQETIVVEIEKLLEVAAASGADLPKPVPLPYRRESGRRSSDALLMEEAVRRRSTLSATGDKRASVYGSIVVPDAILSIGEEDEN